ncbi:MAG: helix-turn-helix domain-containing protein, partial [Proteobacteria bacterium]|nr:helix-turn-helix domain-containing protein [Pseudomonadota bacterium]
GETTSPSAKISRPAFPGTSRPTVRKWLRRFDEAGIEGLLSERSPGRPPEVDPLIREELVRLPRETRPPFDLGDQWTTRTLGAVFEVSPTSVSKVWRKAGYDPPQHLQQVEHNPDRLVPLRVELRVPAWFKLHLEVHCREWDITLDDHILDALTGPDRLDVFRDDVLPGLRVRWTNANEKMERVDPRAPGQRAGQREGSKGKSEGAAAGIEIDECGGAFRQVRQHPFDEHRLARRGRLQEAAGRRLDRDAGEIQPGRAPEHDRLGRRRFAGLGAGGPGQARQVLALGEGGQRLARLKTRRLRGYDQQVGPLLGLGQGHGRGLARLEQGREGLAQRRQQAHEPRGQEQAGLEIHHRVALAAVEAERHAGLGPGRRKGRAPAGAGRNPDHRLDRDLAEAAARQCLGHQALLPARVGLVGQVLQGAAAANAEMGTGRLGPARTLFEELQHLALEAAGARPGQAQAHPVAGHGEGHEDRAPVEAGEAVAARAQALDARLELPAATLARPPPHGFLPGMAR